MPVPDSESAIPNDTLDTIARSFFKSADRYGFRQLDYIRFVNRILDMSMKNGEAGNGERLESPRSAPEPCAALPVKGDEITIRDYDPSTDRPLFEPWMADEAGRLFLLSRITARPLEVDHLLSGHDTVLGIITLHDGQPIGLMAFLDHDRMQKKAELRKLIGDPQYRGKGYGKQATSLWIRYGASCLGLRKIYLNTLETDLRNIRLNEKLGFKVEGILRNECWFDGEYHDILRMALLVE